MSKTSDISKCIEDLRKCATTISIVADYLTEFLSNEVTSQQTKTPAEPTLTLEAVRAVLAEKSRNGYTAQIRSLLQKYGVSKLSQIDPANYKALLEDVGGLNDGN